MEYCFLAFPGNPAIKGESRVPDKSQKVKAFLHLRQSPESVENCLLAFRAFPGIPGKPGEHGHILGFFLKLILENSGLLVAGSILIKSQNATILETLMVKVFSLHSA